MQLPDPLSRLIKELTYLPSIGPRQATRLAFHLLGERNRTASLAQTLEGVLKIKRCERCDFIHTNEGNLCDICSSPTRRHDVIMIVEKETDLLSLEQTKRYNGEYFILGTMPRNGIISDEQYAKLQKLQKYITDSLGGNAKEIILALNPTSSGDFFATTIAKQLQEFTEKISRLGRGLPTGGEIEFADDETLGSALVNRG